MRIHCGTVIQTTFAVLDGGGNLANHAPLKIEVLEFSAAAFADAFAKIAQARAQLEAQDAPQSPSEPAEEN